MARLLRGPTFVVAAALFIATADAELTPASLLKALRAEEACSSQEARGRCALSVIQVKSALKAPTRHRGDIKTIPKEIEPSGPHFPRKPANADAWNFSAYNRWDTMAPEIFEENPTGVGKFTVWKFPLGFSQSMLFWRRFAVDMPTECQNRTDDGCPILFDFHGSYDSLYTQRLWTGWYKYQESLPLGQKFILVTPEGSPDAVTWPARVVTNWRKGAVGPHDRSYTSWNVLGWGDLSPAINEKGKCMDNRRASCFSPAAFSLKNAYPCFNTQLMQDPDVCTHVALEQQRNIEMVNINKCASASAANDWDYMHYIVPFVVRHYRGDSRRIYFTGQSMGGMAAVQFSVNKGRYALPEQFRPAAVAACSSSGSRNNQAELNGVVPTLLMQGDADNLAPGTPAHGYTRKGLAWDATALNEMHFFVKLRKDRKYVELAMNLTHHELFPMTVDQTSTMLLRANLMKDHDVLKDAWGTKVKTNMVGCHDAYGNRMAVDMSGYMWEPFKTAIARAAGKKVDMANLVYTSGASTFVSEKAAALIGLQCATVPETKASVRACVFGGGHDWPWEEFGRRGRRFLHDFIWQDFLKGGALKRP